MKKLAGIIGIVALATACGTRQTAGTSPGSPGAAAVEPPPLERVHPALEVVPIDASYIAVGTVGALVRTANELLQPFRGLPVPIYVDRISELSGEFLGVDVLSLESLDAVGIDIAGSAAIYSTGLLPTFALPVKDPAALEALLARYRGVTGVTVRDSSGVEVVRWQPIETFAVTYAVLDRWLLVHMSDPTRSPDADAWLAATRTAMQTHAVGADAALVNAARAARASLHDAAEVGVLGLARMDRVVASVLDVAGDVHYMTACLGAVRDTVRDVAVGVQLTDGGAEGVVTIALAPEAAAAVREHTAAGPPAGLRAYRARAALYGDLALDARWLDDALGGAGCPVLGLSNATAMLDQFGGRSASVAIEQFVPSSMNVRMGAYLGLSSRKTFTRNVLDTVPGRSFIESSVTIGGRKAKSIDLGVVPRIVYAVDNTGVLGAVGSGVANVVFGADGPAARGTMLVAAGVRPGRASDLGESLTALFELAGIGRARAASRAAMRMLSHYEEGEISLELVGNAVEVRGRMKLAR